jgi:colicin import membrane protein
MDTNLEEDPAIISAAEQHKSLAARTRHLEVINAQGFEEAASYLKTIKGVIAQIDDAEERIKRPLMEGLAELRKQAKDARQPYLETEVRVKAALLKYSQAQEAIRLAAQRKADDAARKERERLQAIADEARAKAVKEAQERREAAEREAAAGREEEAARMRDQAARMEARGEAKAEQFEGRAQAQVAPVIQSEAPKVAGITKRDNWCCRIKDKTKLPEAFKIPDEPKINKAVRSLKLEALDLLGGPEAVEIYNDPLIASGRA